MHVVLIHKSDNSEINKEEIIICPDEIKFMILAGCGYDDASYILGRPVPLAYVPNSRNGGGWL